MLLFGRREKRLSKESQDRIADLGAYAEETINGLRAVQAFTYEKQARRRFDATVERSFQTATRRILTRTMLILTVILFGFGAITFALWVGGRDVVTGRMTGGELSAFVLYAVLLATAGASLSEVWVTCSAPPGPPNGCWTCWPRSHRSEHRRYPRVCLRW